MGPEVGLGFAVGPEEGLGFGVGLVAGVVGGPHHYSQSPNRCARGHRVPGRGSNGAG